MTHQDKILTLFEEVSDATEYPSPEILFDDYIDAATTAAQSIVDWLDEVESYVNVKKSHQLRKLCLKAVSESISLSDLRKIQPLQEQIAEELEQYRDRLEAEVDLLDEED